jgi:predicted porin
MSRKNLPLLALMLSTLLFVGACTSGSDSQTGITLNAARIGAGTTAPAAPVLTLGFGIKKPLFSWAPVDGAVYYRLFEDADGFSGYTQIGGNLTTTIYDHDIALYLRPTARYILEACNNAGCTASDVVDVTSTLAQGIGYFKASNTGKNDHLGVSVALSDDGQTLAIGAYLEDSNATGVGGDETNNKASNSGAVYVFSRSGSTWAQQAYLKASNTDKNDRFGIAVALSGDGNTLVVGADQEDSNATGIDGDGANNGASNAGAVYVYTRIGSVWSQQAYVKASNTQASDFFGYALTLSGDGNTLAVGAYQEDSNATGIDGDDTNNGASNAGAVYMYTRIGSVWSQQAYVKASNTGKNDRFGIAVALSGDGNTLVVGADQEDSNAIGIDGNQTNNKTANSGAVYVFSRSGSTWAQQAYVKASNTGKNDHFGTAVALSGNGDTLAVGANQKDSSAGAAYVFARSGASWSEEAYVQASNTEASDSFGYRVALSGDGKTLAVSAYQENSNATGINGDQFDTSAASAGAVYVFTRSAETWSQQAYVKASNTDTNDHFGLSLALSADGNTLAVGADQEQSNATGIGGDQGNNALTKSGAVYLY